MKNQRKSPEMKIPIFKELLRRNLLRADEIIEKKFEPEEKRLDKALERLRKREFVTEPIK